MLDFATQGSNGDFPPVAIARSDRHYPVMNSHSYIRVSWRHDTASEPIELWSELDTNRYETRKLEIYRDGRVGYADAAQEVEGTVLSELPLPTLAEIGSDSQFEPQEVSRLEFEALWRESSAKVR